MLSLFLFTFSLLSFGETQTFQPVIIEANPLEAKAPRSTYWPTSVKPSPKQLQQPQIDDSFNRLGGVQARSQGSPTVSIRGSGQSGRVLTLYNDIPLNFSSGFSPSMIFVPKEIVENVVIVKGPASLFYGSQAMSGSVNLIPKKYSKSQVTFTASDTDESFIPWREGSLGHNSAHIVTPVVQSKNHHSQASYFTETSDGQFPYQSPDTSGLRQDNNQNLSRALLSGSVKVSSWSLDYDLLWGRQIVHSPGATNSPVYTRENTQGLLASFAPKIVWQNNSVEFRQSFINSQSDFSGDFPNFTDQQTWISQLEWQSTLTDSLFIQFFADFFNHTLNSSDTGKRRNESRFELAPLINSFLGDNWVFQMGGRYIKGADLFLPTLGVYYQPGKLKSWITYSEGYRAPTLSDQFANTPFFVGNPDLSAEKAKQYELGFKILPEKKNAVTTYKLSWDLELRFFYIDYFNFIDSTLLSPNVFTRVNGGNGESYGADLSSQFAWGPWEASLQYNYLKAKSKETGDPFRLSPVHQFSFGLSHFIGPFRLELQNTHWNEFYDITFAGPTRLNDWNQWNFLIHSYGFSNLNFSVGILNAFNQAKELTRYYPEPQRRYWAQVRWSF